MIKDEEFKKKKIKDNRSERIIQQQQQQQKKRKLRNVFTNFRGIMARKKEKSNTSEQEKILRVAEKGGKGKCQKKKRDAW